MSETTLDYSEYFTEIIENQQTEIEQLTYQTQLLEEEINGLNIVVHFQNELRTIFIVAAAFFILWKIIAKWIFGGV